MVLAQLTQASTLSWQIIWGPPAPRQPCSRPGSWLGLLHSPLSTRLSGLFTQQQYSKREEVQGLLERRLGSQAVPRQLSSVGGSKSQGWPCPRRRGNRLCVFMRGFANYVAICTPPHYMLFCCLITDW